MKHTKGKWLVSKSGHPDFNLCVLTKKDGALANSNLIGAAPELLEALKSTLFDVEKRCTDLEFECEKYSTWIKAKEAIKKAEGN